GASGRIPHWLESASTLPHPAVLYDVRFRFPMQPARPAPVLSRHCPATGGRALGVGLGGGLARPEQSHQNCLAYEDNTWSALACRGLPKARSSPFETHASISPRQAND